MNMILYSKNNRCLICFLLLSFNTLKLYSTLPKFFDDRLGLKRGGVWGWSGGYNLTNKSLEVGFLRAGFGKNFTINIITTSIELMPQHNIIAPKISFEQAFIYVAWKVSLANYSNLRQSTMVLTPQIGLTVLGCVNVFFGYAIKMDNTDLNVPQQNIAMILNWPLQEKSEKKVNRFNRYK